MDKDLKNFLIKSVVVFVLVTTFYFVTSPYHNCLIDDDIGHLACLSQTSW